MGLPNSIKVWRDGQVTPDPNSWVLTFRTLQSPEKSEKVGDPVTQMDGPDGLWQSRKLSVFRPPRFVPRTGDGDAGGPSRGAAGGNSATLRITVGKNGIKHYRFDRKRQIIAL